MSRILKKSNGGKIKNAVKLEVNGIVFKSKLELFTYNNLLAFGIDDFKYEQEKFTLIEPFVFDTSVELNKKTKLMSLQNPNVRAVTYLPDFTRIDDKGVGWVLECKGYPNDGWANKLKMFKQYLVENDFKIDLFIPNNQKNVLECLKIIKEKYYEKV